MGPLFAQRFAINIFRHRVEIGELVFDAFFSALENDAINGFVGEFVGGTALALYSAVGKVKVK